MASTVPDKTTRVPAGGRRTTRRRRGVADEQAEGFVRHPLKTLTGVEILGIGAAVPDEVVTNEQLGELGYDADWIVQRTGIQQRRRATAEQSTSELGCTAAERCLESAGVDAEDVDLIVLATMSPDMPAPSTACHLQRRLGATAPAMDVSAACAGFIFALVTGMQFAAGGYRRVLVVGADLMSRTVNPTDHKTFPLFGDGAGAVLLGPGSPQQGLLSYTLGSDGRGADLLCIPGGGTLEPHTAESLAAGRQYLHMDGRAVFKWAVRMLTDTLSAVVKDAGLTMDEVDLVILHQANARILDAAAANLNIDADKLLMNLDRYGNTSAGSMPLVLDEAVRDGRVRPGSRILLSGFGAGLAWGTALFQW